MKIGFQGLNYLAHSQDNLAPIVHLAYANSHRGSREEWSTLCLHSVSDFQLELSVET